jgi:hypothetical protein
LAPILPACRKFDATPTAPLFSGQNAHNGLPQSLRWRRRLLQPGYIDEIFGLAENTHPMQVGGCARSLAATGLGPTFPDKQGKIREKDSLGGKF